MGKSIFSETSFQFCQLLINLHIFRISVGFQKILIFFIGGMVMKSCTVIIQNSEGLHARPATFFIQKANSYASTLWIAKDPEKARLAAEEIYKLKKAEKEAAAAGAIK